MVKLQVNGFNSWNVSSACCALNRRELTSRLAFAAAVKQFKPPRCVNLILDSSCLVLEWMYISHIHAAWNWQRQSKLAKKYTIRRGHSGSAPAAFEAQWTCSL